MDNFIQELCLKIKNGEIVSPFLFFGKNQDIVNSDVNNIGLSILKELNIPKSYLFNLKDDGEAIKINNIKNFLTKGNLKSSYACQIFFIENISRLTLSAGNSCLKFFEEPGKGNIIFLTNTSESQVLDTILSRVVNINPSFSSKNKKDEFNFSLIDSYINKQDISIFSYFFKEKIEKDEYIKFLENIIYYSKEKGLFRNILFSLEDDINSIKNNNVSAKFIVDKFLIELSLKK